MPLSKSSLATQLEAVMKHPGATIEACAKLWADAVAAYFAGVAPPSATQAPAKVSLQSALATAFAGTTAADTATALELAFKTYGAALGGGMAPAFTSPGPAGPVGFLTLFQATPKPSTHAAAADKVATAIDAWARTGISTPPTGSPITWT